MVPPTLQGISARSTGPLAATGLNMESNADYNPSQVYVHKRHRYFLGKELALLRTAETTLTRMAPSRNGIIKYVRIFPRRRNEPEKSGTTMTGDFLAFRRPVRKTAGRE